MKETVAREVEEVIIIILVHPRSQNLQIMEITRYHLKISVSIVLDNSYLHQPYQHQMKV